MMILDTPTAAAPPWIELPLVRRLDRSAEDGVALVRADGPIVLTHDGAPIPLDADGIVVVDRAAALDGGGGTGRMLSFGRGQLGHALGVGRDLLPIRLDPEDAATSLVVRLWDMLRDLDATGLADAPAGWALAEALCLVVAEAAGRAGGGARTSHAARSLHRARRLIAENAHSADFDVAALTALMGVSTRQLSALFAQAGGSPGKALAEHRLQMARTMLGRSANARTSIGSVATACGFADPAYFSRSFKRRFGMLPKNARQPIAS